MAVLTDPIADMLTRVRNAAIARHLDVDVPVSKMHLQIAKILHREGYIRGYQLINRGRTVRIRLRYDEHREPVIQGLKRISKPGRRIYAGKDELPRVIGGLGVAIISTSQGVLTDRQARERGVGGEVVGQIW